MANLIAIGMDNITGQIKIGTSSDVLIEAGGTNSGGVMTSGAAPTTTIVSGTAKQISTIRDVFVWIPVTFNGTALLTASAKVEISADNSTFSTLSTETFPALLGLLGTVQSITLFLRAGHYVRITTTNASVGTVSYW